MSMSMALQKGLLCNRIVQKSEKSIPTAARSTAVHLCAVLGCNGGRVQNQKSQSSYAMVLVSA